MKVRTSVLRGLAYMALGSLAFAACDEKEPIVETPPVITVTVTPSTADLRVGESIVAGASVTGTSNTAVTWSSSNAAVASVSAAGVITAVAPGSALITAQSAADANARGFVAVIVRAAAPPTITLAPATGTIVVGQTLQLVGNVTGHANTGITYQSSAAGIASVSATGLVTGVAPGTAVITAIAAADNTVRATSVITVQSATSNVQVQVIPNTASTPVGGTVQFVANVTGTTNTAVTWRTSSPTVATVDGSGLATGVAAGTAVITAISNADTLQRASATLTVTPAAPPPSISIQNVVPLGPNNAATGTITATINVSADVSHDVRVVATRLGGVPVCSQTFNQPLGTTQGVAIINCQINTAALDAAGAPIFPNGPHALTAVALNGAGDVVAQANFGDLNVTNADAANAVVSFVNPDGPSSAIGGDGLLWNSGDVVVTIRPALYSGATAQAISVGLDVNCNGTSESIKSAVANNGEWIVTFAKEDATGAPDNGSADISDNNVCIRILAAASTGGQPLAITGVVGGSFRLDNLAPLAPTLAFPASVETSNCTVNPLDTCAWLGPNFTFSATPNPVSTTATATNVSDDGCPECSNVVTVTWHVALTADVPGLGATAAEQDEAIAAMPAITSATQLQSTIESDAYTVVAKVRDVLGNYILVRHTMLFGVDLTNPTIAVGAGSAANNSANPAQTIINYNVTDDFSGARLLRARITGYSVLEVDADAGTEIRCYDNAGTDITPVPFPGMCPTFDLMLAAGVPPTTGTAAVNIPQAATAENLYVIEVQGVDAAGNLSPVNTRTVLIDVTDPFATITTTTVAGTSVSIAGTVSDNIDLRAYDVRFLFAGAAGIPDHIPFTAQVTVDTFGLPLVGVANAAGSNAVAVRELNTGTVAAPVFVNPSQFGFGVVDQASRFGFTGVAYGVGGGDGVEQLTDITSSQSVASGNVCATTTSGACPGSTNLSVVAEVGATGTNPFSNVYVYFVHKGPDNTIDTADDYLVLIAILPASAAQIQTGPTVRTFTWVHNVPASTFPTTGANRLVAIGVDPEGDAILAPLVAINRNN